MSMHPPVRTIVAALAAGAMVGGSTLGVFAAPVRKAFFWRASRGAR
jgi:hypothetical protein